METLKFMSKIELYTGKKHVKEKQDYRTHTYIQIYTKKK